MHWPIPRYKDALRKSGAKVTGPRRDPDGMDAYTMSYPDGDERLIRVNPRMLRDESLRAQLKALFGKK